MDFLWLVQLKKAPWRMLVNPTFNRIILSEVHQEKSFHQRLFTFGGNAILCKLSQNINARLEIILTVLDNSIVVSRSHPKNASSGKHSILDKIEGTLLILSNF